MDILVILLLIIFLLCFVIPGILKFILMHPFLIIGLFVLEWLFSTFRGSDKYQEQKQSKRINRLFMEDFPVLLAYIINQSVRKKELVLSTKEILLGNFDIKTAQKILDSLKTYNQNGVSAADLKTACWHFLLSFDLQDRLKVLSVIRNILENAEGEMSAEEKAAFDTVAEELYTSGRSYNTYENRSNYGGSAYSSQPEEDPYKVLGVSRTSSNEEIKKAYRQLCKQYHPDRTANLPDDEKAEAEQKIRKVISAYDKIKQERPGL